MTAVTGSTARPSTTSPGRPWGLRPSDATAQGYRDEEIDFFAATAPAACTQPAYSYVKNGVHRIALGDEPAALESSGWSSSEWSSTFSARRGPRHRRPADADTTFSFAVMPDTQNEWGTDSGCQAGLLAHRQQGRLDLRWVLHSGDLQNWDTPDHYQFQNMSTRLAPLAPAGLPFVAASATTTPVRFVREGRPAPAPTRV